MGGQKARSMMKMTCCLSEANKGGDLDETRGARGEPGRDVREKREEREKWY